MHRVSVTSCFVVLIVALAAPTRAADVHALEELLRRVDVDVVQDDEVVAWLREARDPSHLSEALRVAVGEARSSRRAATALAALVVVDPAAAPVELARALTHPSSEVRIAALALLGEVEAPAASAGLVRGGLLGVLTRGPRREAALAIEALGTWGEPATCMLPILEAAERDPTHTDVGLDALATIVGTDAGDLSAWWRLWAASAPLWPEHPVLIAVVDDGDPEAVLAALEKLARLPDPRTFAAIERLVRRRDADGGGWGDPSAEQQGAAAARALGLLRDPRGRPALQVILDAESASDALLAHARWALARLRRDGARRTARSRASWSLAAADATPPPTSAARGDRAPRRSARVVEVDVHLAAAFAWAIAAVALATAALAALARRFQRPAPLRSARTADAARFIARTLREIEVEPVSSLRQAPEPPVTASPHAPQAPEGGDDFVHVVLGHSPRWQERRVVSEAAPDDPAWQSVMAGLDELGGNVGRVVVRVNGADERVVYAAGEDVSLADAMVTLSGLRGSLDDVRVELARTGASMVVYTSRADPAPLEPAPVERAAAPEPADLGWTGLVTALEELGPSIAEVWAQVAGEDARRRWPVESADLATALAALGELRSQVVRAGVCLVGGSGELVMFEGPPPPSVPVKPADAAWVGLLHALRSMADSVAGLSARLRCPAGSPPVALFPSPDVPTLADALAALEGLEPLVVEVRVQLAGVRGELVLLDRDAAPASIAAGPAAHAMSVDWLELVRAVEEVSYEVEAVVVRGTDGETVVLRGDDEGGVPELLASLQALEGTAAHVRVRLARGGGELVLLDLPASEAPAPAPAGAPTRTSRTWQHVLGSIEAMGGALDAISALVVGADRRLLFGPGTPCSLEQALSALGDAPDAFQDVKIRLKHSTSELTLFDRALAS